MEEVRIDKYLWAIRAFKTRNEAAEACNGGKVKIDGVSVKPAKAVKPGDTITVRKAAVQYTYRVVETLNKRVGAKDVAKYALDLTPQTELDKLKAPVEMFVLKRDKGTGRPTKKDRRTIDAMMESLEDNEG